MPELPEVECLTNAVRSIILGGRLVEMQFLRGDLREPIPMRKLKQIGLNQTINAVERRSKYMLWEIGGENYGIFHLGMSGNMLLADSAKPQEKHTHAVFKILDKENNPQYLHFVDPRRFGRIACCKKSELKTHRLFRELGPEPLSTPNMAEHLFERSRKKNQPIKSFLMDARNVVGIGNIYASESLFRAGIFPMKKAGKVSKESFEVLAEKIKETLKDAIRAGGTTFSDFRNVDGQSGYFVNELLVYNREGLACGNCGDKVRQKTLSGRSTYYCRSCQR